MPSRLIIIRHASNSRNKIQRLKILCEQLRPYIIGSVAAYKSTASRVLMSEDVISRVLGLSFERSDELATDSNHPLNLQGILGIIEFVRAANTIVLLTNSEVAEAFPFFYVCDVLNTQVDWGALHIGLGEVIIVALDQSPPSLTILR